MTNMPAPAPAPKPPVQEFPQQPMRFTDWASI